MRTRLRNWIYLRRLLRLKRSFTISSFTIFLLGFGFIYWVANTLTVVALIGCEYALVWLTGWFKFQSLYQLFFGATFLALIVWLLRIAFLRDLNLVETSVQFTLIFFISAALIAQKAYMFPNAFPSQEQVKRIVQVIYPMDLRLAEESDPFFNFRENWKYDYPSPPFAHFPEPPRWSREIDRPLTEIFRDEHSPLYSEMKEVRACYANYKRAEIQYERDRETWEEYWKGFDDWYALNRWRYGE